MAGVGGIEPPNDDTKNRCLTTWRHPSNYTALANSRRNNAYICILQRVNIRNFR